MIEQPPTMIIDSHYIAHQAKYAMRELRFDGNETGIIFGFLSRILTLGMRFKTNDFVFLWDSRSSKRKKLMPLYKSKRKEMTIEEQKEMILAKIQFTKLRRKILPAIGFKNVYIQKGFEGDDLIAKFVLGRLGEFIIVSADEDLFQCLQANTKIYTPSKKRFMTRRRFITEYGINPSSWRYIKALAGCSSDGVPGIRGVGEKTALKFWKGVLDKKSKIYKKIEEKKEAIFKKNIPLVFLPFEGTEDLKHLGNDFDFKTFKKICRKYGMVSFLEKEKLKEWKVFFSGTFASDSL